VCRKAVCRGTFCVLGGRSYVRDALSTASAKRKNLPEYVFYWGSITGWERAVNSKPRRKRG